MSAQNVIIKNLNNHRLKMSQTGNKTYWKGYEELTSHPEFEKRSNNEFSEYLPVGEFLGQENVLESSSTSRRDFLKFLGFGVTAAAMASCETPVTKAIPYLVKPEEVNPGVANYYASTYYDGNDYSSILVKTREGRPIFIEGNKLSTASKGLLNARVNSSVLMLYDSNRLQGPVDTNGEPISWTDADAAISTALNSAAAKNGKIRILTNTIISPSTQAVINNFSSKFGGEGAADVKHITYDTISYSGIIEANEISFGKPFVPNYNFAKAKTLVSIGADFLSTWLNSIEYAGQYAMNRKPESGRMSRHYQFEAGLSVSGSNADYRIMVKPSEFGQIAVNLYNAIADLIGGTKVSGGNDSYSAEIQKAAKDLVSVRGESLVISGSNDKSVQIVINGINQLLDNYGRSVDIDHPSYLRKGKDSEVKTLIDEMNSGSVSVLIISGVNPAKSLPASFGFSEAMTKVGTSVSLGLYRNETASMSTYSCPDNHYLESWNDAEPTAGKYSLTQPVISKLYDTRQFQESLMAWSGQTGTYMAFMKNNWSTAIGGEASLFDQKWNKALHDGVYEVHSESEHETLPFNADVQAAVSSMKKESGEGFEIFLYQKTGIGDGSHVSNPLLQELPDPITKITWDNYLTMSPEDMDEYSFNKNLGQEQKSNVVKLSVNGVTIDKVPVVAQPGQTRGTLGLALGYGNTAWKQLETIGVNAYPITGFNGNIQFSVVGAKIEDTGEKYNLAATQTSHTVMGRTGVVRETTLSVYNGGNRDEFNPVVTLPTHEGREAVKSISLWEEHPVETSGHHWGMSIDLNTCTGCSACITACNSENNVPIVGKDEVRRGREMHWLRIDRYYSTDADTEDKSISSYRAMENPGISPEVVFQPMMCQHCNHAPCETVCPVAATTHSLEGLNQMTYNRCIGTRYCANNCPYKVRRFNWFNYMADSKFTGVNPAQDDLGRLVLNPDVTVRARGVMEKCSLCVQRIQAGKLEAKKSGSRIEDGAIQTACSSACPTNAITFGDINDKNSKVAMAHESDRAYKVIEDVGTKPNIAYQTKVRNKDKAEA